MRLVPVQRRHAQNAGLGPASQNCGLWASHDALLIGPGVSTASKPDAGPSSGQIPTGTRLATPAAPPTRPHCSTPASGRTRRSRRGIYLDHGLTGTTRARPGPDQPLALVQTGDTLVAPELDRLARSVPDPRSIGDDLAAHGIALSLGRHVYDPAVDALRVLCRL
ncbi:recombinase family protein [Saccharopolyspora gloriosae]|uniref:recombinase family protein n=1 Tax=Saccharopolyspora gloriosae TaxID=455344 RepID=UPI001FB7A99D|nr:recombinase family protein [Saccharopolyspora gloriosae]